MYVCFKVGAINRSRTTEITGAESYRARQTTRPDFIVSSGKHLTQGRHDPVVLKRSSLS